MCKNSLYIPRTILISLESVFWGLRYNSKYFLMWRITCTIRVSDKRSLLIRCLSVSTHIDSQLSISRNKHDMSQDMVPSSLSSIEHTLWDGGNICMVFVSVYRIINWKSDYQQIIIQNLIGLNYWHKIWI